MTTFVFALAFVATATLAPVAQAVETTSTATTTVATTTVATTTATTTPATNSTIAGLMAQLAKLTTLFNELKLKLAGTQAEIKELRADIREGMTDADVKTIQELLASDPTIYPKGLVTGYFGPMTKEAIMRFQVKNGLEVTGLIDTETRAAMDAIIAERRAQGKFPIGLLMAPGLKMKFEDKLKKRCESVVTATSTATTTVPVVGCEKMKAKYKFEMDDKGRIKIEMKMEDDEDDNMNEDEDEDDDSSKIPTLKDADRQINDAIKALTNVKKKLANKDYVTGLSATVLADVKSDIVQAEKDIADAKLAKGAMNFVKAVMLAEKAEEMLDDAKDILEGENDEDEDEDEDDN